MDNWHPYSCVISGENEYLEAAKHAEFTPEGAEPYACKVGSISRDLLRLEAKIAAQTANHSLRKIINGS